MLLLSDFTIVNVVVNVLIKVFFSNMYGKFNTPINYVETFQCCYKSVELTLISAGLFLPKNLFK